MITGISGGIGSGKSVVSRILRLRGFAVYDCDSEAKRIMDCSEEVLEALHSRYGESVCPPGGPICRSELARRLFGSDEERLWLNSLVHRLVREDIGKWHDEQTKKGNEICFVESAILASSGLAKMCSEIWLVTASDNVRISRVQARDSLDEKEICRRIRSQENENQLLSETDIPVRIIDNSGLEPLLPATTMTTP